MNQCLRATGSLVSPAWALRRFLKKVPAAFRKYLGPELLRSLEILT